VLKSDRFAIDHNSKKNLTLACLQKLFVDSMIPLASCDDAELHGWSVHLCVSKGDWKHKREWLAQSRHYGNVAGPNGQPGQICPRCLADSSRERPWADMAERFNNQADLDEAARTSVGRDIELFRLPGYDASCEYPDLLHCLWLGTGRDAVGSLTMLLARFWPPVQHYDTFDERLRHIHFDLREWCRQHGLRPSTIDEL
ncbi:Cpr, partial [Symbiodinium sp. CCMP2592]